MKKLIVIMLLLLLPILSFGQDGGINRGLISGPYFIPSLIGTTTWGFGSGFTWTFDAGATDPTFTFGSGTVLFRDAVFTFPNVGLSAYDTNASHYLIFKPGSDLTANKTLTFTTGDSDRTITLSGNPTLADWFDQAVKIASSPTFANITDSGLTITRIPFASTAGLLVDDADMTFVTDTLTVTKIIGSTSVTSPIIYGSSSASGTLTLTSTSSGTLGNISIGRLTLSDLADSSGIVFGSLGTATRGIDLSASGLSGAADYWIYISGANYWSADGTVGAITFLASAKTYYRGTNITILPSAPQFYITNTGTANVIGITLKHPGVAGLFGDISDTPVGSLTACSSNGTTTITKTTHGLTLAAGELVHVTGSSTTADKGFYRVVSSAESTIVVDRVLSGTQTDVALTVYKNVISMHATDATNGQMLTSWSAQNKPLQLGGTVLAATTTLTSKDLYIGGNIGFSGETANGTVATTITSLGPTGTATTIQGWVKIIDSGGTARYIPYW